MDQWADIRRRVLVDGESKRSVQRHYKLHWKTLQKILSQPEPPGYRQSRPRAKKKLGPFLPVIEEILRQDRHAPPKQRHTAKRVFERLRAEHGYTGGLTVVKEAVHAWRQQHAEAFVPLAHRPGEAQVDFGHAEVTLGGVPTKVALFVMTLPYSDALFCCAFPREWSAPRRSWRATAGRSTSSAGCRGGSATTTARSRSPRSPAAGRGR